MPKLQNWTDAQEKAFVDWVNRTSCPKVLVNVYRKGMRDRKYTAEQIKKFGPGLLPCN